MSEEQRGGGSIGPSTDRDNSPVIDPTINVLRDIAAAVTRINDLREADEKLRAAENRRQDDLREAETRHVREIDLLLVEHAQQLRGGESNRIDAILAVNVATSQQALKDAETRASALAATVATTATAFEGRLAAVVGPIQQRIDDLTRAQFQAEGQKAQVVERHASGANVGLWIGVAFGAFALMLSFVAVIVSLYIATR